MRGLPPREYGDAQGGSGSLDIAGRLSPVEGAFSAGVSADRAHVVGPTRPRSDCLSNLVKVVVDGPTRDGFG